MGSVNLWDPQGNPGTADESEVDGLLAQGYRLATDEEVDAYVPGGVVNLVSPDLQGGTAEASNLGSLLQQGYRLATPTEVETGDIYDPNTMGATVLAGAEGLARGVTLGLSDLAIKGAAGFGAGLGNTLAGGEFDLYDETAADQAGEAIEARKAASPIVAGATEIAGAVAPALLTGGASAVASGGKATAQAVMRLTPAAFVSRLGASLTSALKTPGGGRVAAVLAGAAGAAVEGIVDTGARIVTQDMIDGKLDVTAERLATELVTSAGISALAGGVFNGRRVPMPGAVDDVARSADVAAGVVDDVPVEVPGVTVPPPRPAADIDLDIEAARARLDEMSAAGDSSQADEAAEVLDELLTQRDKSVADSFTVPEKAIADQFTPSATDEAKSIWENIKTAVSASKTANEAQRKFDDAVDQLTREITEDLNQFQRLDQNVIEPTLTRNKKPKATAGVLAKSGIEWTPERADGVMTVIGDIEGAVSARRAELADMVSGDRGPAANQIKLAEQAIQRVRKRLTGLSAQGPVAPGARIMTADLEQVGELFRDIDDLRTYIGKLAAPRGLRGTDAEFFLQKQYAKIRAMQLNRGIWGNELAEMQGLTNVAIKNNIDATGPMMSMLGRAQAQLGESAGEADWFKLQEFDEAKLKSYLAKLGDGDHAQAEKTFGLGLQRRIEHNDTLSKFYPGGGARDKALSEQRAIRDAVASKIRTIKTLKAMRDRTADEAAKTRDMQSAMQSIDAIFNSIPVAGPALLAAIRGTKAVAGVVTNEAVMAAAKKENAIAKAVGNAVKQVQTGVGAVRSGARAAVEALPQGGYGVSASVIKRAYEEAQEMQDPTSARRMEFDRQVDAVAKESPEFAAMMRKVALDRSQAILDTMPKPDDSDPLSDGATKPRSDTEANSAARYIMAARDPHGAIQRISEGRGSDEDIRALRVLYPALYRSFGERVIAKAKASKVKLSAAQRQRLHRMTGMPTMAEHDPARFASIQATAQAMSQPKEQPEPGRRGGGKPVDPDALMARSDALMTDD